MAKKIKKTIESVESELDDVSLLGGSVAEITIKEPEIVAVIKPTKKEKILLGFHPITGAEVWK